MAPELILGLRALHLLAVIVWVGGLVSVCATAASDSGNAVAGARRTLRFVVNPSMLVAWLAALAMLLEGWSTLYARAGWMHGKITIALILSALTGIVGGRLRRASNGQSQGLRGTMIKMALATLVLAALNIVLAKFQFGSS